MGIFKEFKEFAIKGNMVDMAIGIVIGTAFNKVIDVLVKQIVMPPLSIMTDGINFSDRKIVLRDGVSATEAGVSTVEEIAIGYGALIEAMLDFLIIGVTIFIVVRVMNKFRNRAEDPKNPKEVTPKDIELLSNLNDLMEEQNRLLKQKGE